MRSTPKAAPADHDHRPRHVMGHRGAGAARRRGAPCAAPSSAPPSGCSSTLRPFLQVGRHDGAARGCESLMSAAAAAGSRDGTGRCSGSSSWGQTDRSRPTGPWPAPPSWPHRPGTSSISSPRTARARARPPPARRPTIRAPRGRRARGRGPGHAAKRLCPRPPVRGGAAHRGPSRRSGQGHPGRGRELGAGLIVIGSKGVERRILGSVPNAITHDADATSWWCAPPEHGARHNRGRHAAGASAPPGRPRPPGVPLPWPGGRHPRCSRHSSGAGRRTGGAHARRGRARGRPAGRPAGAVQALSERSGDGRRRSAPRPAGRRRGRGVAPSSRSAVARSTASWWATS